jgi:hypothetical protein
VGPACQHHHRHRFLSLLSLETAARRSYSPGNPSRVKCHQDPLYKIPTISSPLGPFPLSRLRRQAVAIPRRRSAHLQTSRDIFDVDGEPNTPSPSPSSFSCLCAPPHAFGSCFFAGNQARHHEPEAPAALHVSSPPSAPVLEAIDHDDHAFDITVNRCTPFTCSPASGRTRTSPTINPWPQPRRRLVGNPSPTVSSPFFPWHRWISIGRFR